MSSREHFEVRGLISYGVDLNWCFHRAAYYVDTILKGTKPADLALEFPTEIELVINLKTAKALGLEIPQTLLARADEVIEWLAAFLPHATPTNFPGGYVVRDANGFAVAYVYGRLTEDEVITAKQMTMDETRRVASNIAKLPEMLKRGN
jgi:ABC transporter substrate binding protein